MCICSFQTSISIRSALLSSFFHCDFYIIYTYCRISSPLLSSPLRCFEDHLPMRSTCTVMRTTSTTTSTAQHIAWHTPSLYYTSHPIKVKNYFIDLYSHFFLRLVPNCVRHDATACILINNCITLSLNVNTAPVLPFFTLS